MDNLEAIRVFVSVATQGSFTEAARRMRLSPSVVTRSGRKPTVALAERKKAFAAVMSRPRSGQRALSMRQVSKLTAVAATLLGTLIRALAKEVNF